MSHLLRPCEWLCPRFGIFLLRDSSVLHEQSHKFDSAPAACQPRGVLFRMSSRPSERAPASKAARPKAITSLSVIQSRIAAISWRMVRPNDPTMLASQAASTRRKHSRYPFRSSSLLPACSHGMWCQKPKGAANMRNQRTSSRGQSTRANALRTISAAPPSPLKRSKSSTRGPSVGLISRGIMPRSSSDRICRASSASR
jgi:hypothetical protein